jgi:NAD(P)-dependent dehydrogenase (short-subunit alcohol dehydrogenase family)
MKKTILITGSTDGIGLETAKILVEQGHRVLLHGRNATKLKDVESMLSETVNGAHIESYVSDLSHMVNVAALASKIAEQHTHLDVVINNAGVYSTSNVTTSDGLDVRFAVNTFAPYFLTKQLLPLLGQSGRVVNLSSAAQTTVNVDALAGKKALSDSEAYAQSKLALTMWSRILGLELKDSGPMIVSVNPASMLGSKMVKDAFGVSGGDLRIGAEVLCRAALSNEFSAAAGLYFDNDIGRFSDPHPDALNDAKSQQVVDTLGAVLARIPR